MADLLYLDLSHNKLEMLPPQIRRLIELKVIINSRPTSPLDQIAILH